MQQKLRGRKSFCGGPKRKVYSFLWVLPLPILVRIPFLNAYISENPLSKCLVIVGLEQSSISLLTTSTPHKTLKFSLPSFSISLILSGYLSVLFKAYPSQKKKVGILLMGLKGRLFWRRLFWRVRAAVKKAREGRRWRKRGSIRFQYDPSSYALNFDDGSKPNYWEEETSTNLAHGGKGNVFQHLNFHLIHSNPTTIVTATTTTSNNTIWVYVFWVKI